MNVFGIILTVVAVVILVKFFRDRARQKAQPPVPPPTQDAGQPTAQVFTQIPGISIKNCQINQVLITNDYKDSDDEDDDRPAFVAVTCPHCGASCRIPAEGGKCDYCNSYLNADS